MPTTTDPAWQGPTIGLQDLILLDFACTAPKDLKLGGPLLCPDASVPGQSTIEASWAEAMLPTVANVGKVNAQAAWWQSKRAGQSALKNVMSGLSVRLPPETIFGRVALVGFSQGCSGVRECLTDERDASRLDFVYACDGLAGQLGPDGNVTRDSIAPWVNYARGAASGRGMMVVTTSEVVHKDRSTLGTANTEESSAALLKYVRQDLGYQEIAPRMIPRGLIGQPGFAPKPADGAWASWSNSLSRRVSINAPWPVKAYTIIGNLIVVNFNAISPEEQAAGYRPSNSEAAHVFQSWWVCHQVLSEVLACRWAAKCEGDNINPETLATRPMSLVAGRKGEEPKMIVNSKFPSVLFDESNLLASKVSTQTAAAGLGAIGDNCVLEGIFSNMLSLDEVQSARAAASMRTAAAGLLGAIAGYYLGRRFSERNR
jgi:hypothetical protein